MTRDQSPEETESEYIKLMGEDLGKIFHALWQEVAWLFAKWGEYVELFGTKPSRIELVNKASPLFFGIVQDSLWEDVILSIARLTDPPKTAGKENLTIRRLPELVTSVDLKTGLDQLIQFSIQATDFCRDWRNRRIAHRDLQLAIESGITPLKKASRKRIKDALLSIVNVLNAVTLHYQDSVNLFIFPKGHGGSESLLYIIDDGLRVAEERRELIKRGDYIEAELVPRDI